VHRAVGETLAALADRGIRATQEQLQDALGVCQEESAEVNRSRRSPQGNRRMRRILNQAANAAVKYKGSIFEILYRRYAPRLGHNQTIGIIAHKLCRLVWKILRRGIRYEERAPEVKKASKQKRDAADIARALCHSRCPVRQIMWWFRGESCPVHQNTQ
jgi:Transposase IS116/IS110/IS902 family